MNIVDVNDVHVIDSAAVPGEKAIARAARQPSDVAEAAAETEVYSPSCSAKSEEGHISRRPDRIVSGIDRSRPPAPVPAINEPASIMIGCPAPGLVGNPGPAVVGFIHPSAVAIRRPIRSIAGKPDLSVVRDVSPMAVSIQVLRSRVIGIGVLPALRAFDHVIAVAVPFVPIVSAGRSGNLILRGVGVALNGDALVALHAGASLRRGYFRGASAHINDGFIVGVYLDAKAAFAHLRADGNVGRFNLRAGIVVLHYVVIHQALPDLNL